MKETAQKYNLHQVRETRTKTPIFIVRNSEAPLAQQKLYALKQVSTTKNNTGGNTDENEFEREAE